MPDLNPPAVDLFEQLTTALGTLIEHVRGDAACRDGCISHMTPQNSSSDCPAYDNAVTLLEQTRRRRTLIVLDTVAAPIAGVENIKIPRGEVGIDLESSRVVLWSKDPVPSYTGAEAIEVGTVLVAAGREAARQPDPDEVDLLARTMADYGDSNLVELARHLLKSGYQRVDSDD
ncbi:hypothetical protein [Nonomuraea sp. NPDC005650]|uniref:hypothetical protein n=1 Tax=Nonomuraea sp. NPDC005650 TaxID=3157045 RepID=UPI0033AB1A84